MKTVSDNEIIDTSRGKKRIGALFDENAMLHAHNADLLAALQALLHEYELAHDDEDERGKPDLDFNTWDEVIQARAAIARATQEN